MQKPNGPTREFTVKEAVLLWKAVRMLTAYDSMYKERSEYVFAHVGISAEKWHGEYEKLFKSKIEEAERKSDRAFGMIEAMQMLTEPFGGPTQAGDYLLWLHECETKAAEEQKCSEELKKIIHIAYSSVVGKDDENA